jgi:hypothetical protein
VTRATFTVLLSLKVYDSSAARLRSPPTQRQTRRRSDSDMLPFRRLWYGGPNSVANAIGYAMHSSRSHDAVSTTAKCVNFVIDLRLRSSLGFI